MGVEIERKFLVLSEEFKQEATHSAEIRQFYLHSPNKEETLRLRLIDGKAIFTRKGLSSEDGLVRKEEEYPLSKEEAEQLLRTPIIGSIEKERYYIPYEGFMWEVDCFHGILEGLILAEVELSSPTDTPILPHWIGQEVTGDKRYYNSQLAIATSRPQ